MMTGGDRKKKSIQVAMSLLESTPRGVVLIGLWDEEDFPVPEERTNFWSFLSLSFCIVAHIAAPAIRYAAPAIGE